MSDKRSCETVKHESIKNRLRNSGTYSENVEKASKIFALLGDPNRMKIMLALLEGELCVYHLCEITGGSQSATSQHLRKLKDERMVKSRREANQILYSIADDHVSLIIKTALEHLKCFSCDKEGCNKCPLAK